MVYWILTTEYPPIYGGGISTYTYHTAQMLIEKGHKVRVFIPDFSVSNIKEEVIENVKIVKFNTNNHYVNKLLGYESALSYVFAEIVIDYIKKEGKPDFIETQEYMGIAYYLMQQKAMLVNELQNIPIVCTMHAPSFLYLEFNQVLTHKLPEFWVGEMERSVIRTADILLSPSNYLINELKPRVELEDKKPIVVRNPYKPEIELKEPDYNYTKNNIVFFGKLIPQKGILELLSYFKHMWDDGFNKKLRVIGGGQHMFYPVKQDMIEYLSNKYEKYIKSGILLFEGQLKPKEIKKRLVNAHIIIIPSIVDNLPYTVLEAMSLGKVVLASKNSGHIELIEHQKTGFLFSHSEKYDFQKQIRHILSLDKQNIEKIGKNAALKIRELTNYNKVYADKIALLNNYTCSKSNKFTYTHNYKIKTDYIRTEINLKEGFSVVIPYYNMGDYIEDTLNSLKASNQNIDEIIIINDGSTEKYSTEKLKELCDNFEVTIYNKENEGLSLTRNFGAKQVKTKYFSFLDADDTVEPDYYKKALKILKQYDNVNFVGCWAQYFGESSDSWATFNPEPPFLLVHNMINSSALVYKTNSFIKYGLNDHKMIYGMEDYDSVLSMVENGSKGVVISEKLWNYRIRNNSMAQSFNRNSELYLYQLMAKKHKVFFSYYASDVVGVLNNNGPGINYDNPSFNTIQTDFLKIPSFNSKLITIVKRNKLLRKLGKKIYYKLIIN